MVGGGGGGMDISSLVTGILGQLVDSVYKGIDVSDQRKARKRQEEIQRASIPLSTPSQALSQVPMLSQR